MPADPLDAVAALLAATIPPAPQPALTVIKATVVSSTSTTANLTVPGLAGAAVSLVGVPIALPSAPAAGKQCLVLIVDDAPVVFAVYP